MSDSGRPTNFCRTHEEDYPCRACAIADLEAENTSLRTRLAALEAENARLAGCLDSIKGALADAGTVLAMRLDGNYAESVRELTRERDRLAALVEKYRELAERGVVALHMHQHAGIAKPGFDDCRTYLCGDWHALLAALGEKENN